MKTGKTTIVAFLGIVLSALSTVEARGLDGDPPHGLLLTSTSSTGATMDMVDHHLLEALRAMDERARRAALRAAQVALDAMDTRSVTVPSANNAPSERAGWLAESEHSINRFHMQAQRELRESLMHKIWESPYKDIAPGNLTALEIISDALRLVNELQRLGGGDAGTLEDLQETYWKILLLHRESAGLEYTALGDMDTSPVFDQRVLRGKDEKVYLYQLTGTGGRLLRWVRVPATNVPAGLLSSEALTIDLSREDARWLLVMDGEGLADHLVAHRHWLEAINREVRLVLLERGDYIVAIRSMPSEWFGQDRRAPYVLPVAAHETPAQLYLVDVSGKRVLGRWPLVNLGGPGGPALKGLINRILAAAKPD